MHNSRGWPVISILILYLVPELVIMGQTDRNAEYCGKNNDDDDYRYTLITKFKYGSIRLMGTIMTRLHKNSYSNNLRCKWVIDSGAFRRVKLTFVKVDLQPNGPYEICEDHDHAIVQAGGFDNRYICPEDYPEQLVSWSRRTGIAFQSDSDSGLFSHTGIEIRYEMFDMRDACPPGWVSGPENLYYHSNCFYLNNADTSKVDFVTAQRYCSYSTANIAKADSQQIFNFFHGIMREQGVEEVWISLNDIEQEGTLVWLDGDVVTDKRRMHGDTFKNTDDKNCVIQRLSRKSWKTVSCSEKHHFFCEVDTSGDMPVYTVPRSSPGRGIDATSDNASMAAIVVASITFIVMLASCGWVCYYQIRRRTIAHQTLERSTCHGSAHRDRELEALSPGRPQDSREPTAPPVTECGTTGPPGGYPNDPDVLPTYEEAMGMVLLSNTGTDKEVYNHGDGQK